MKKWASWYNIFRIVDELHKKQNFNKKIAKTNILIWHQKEGGETHEQVLWSFKKYIYIY